MTEPIINIFFQIALIIMVIAYFTKYATIREPDVSNILKALKSLRYDKAFEIAINKNKLIESPGYTYQQKEMYHMQFRRVIDYLEKRASKEDDPDILNALGWSYIIVRNYEKALGYLKRAEEINCSDHRITLNIAEAMKGMNWHRKALTYYRKTLVFDPDNIDALIGKGEMSYILDYGKSAKEAYLKLLEIDEDNTKGIFGYAMCKFRDEDYDEAYKFFKKIEKNGYRQAHISYCLGKIYYSRSEYQKALEYLDRATELDYFFADAYYIKALIFSVEKNRDLAIQNLANAINVDDSYKEQAKKERLFETYWLFNEFRTLFE